MATQIRAATLDDAGAVARIHVETWRATYAGVLPDSYLVNLDENRQCAQWGTLLHQRRRPHGVLVASVDGAVVGFANHGPVRRDGLPRGVDCDGEIYTLYVDPDYQGLGIGKALLHGCFDALGGNGRKSAIIWVLAANPSRFFYEAMGGRRLAERSETFAGVELLELGYGWDLQGL